ncbi:Uncharacterised protein [Mycobacteroides abscessus subsp. massiliense]|nr:Uncharacterised protein [Mycobacteroides abscessus subsp. massiliense]
MVQRELSHFATAALIFLIRLTTGQYQHAENGALNVFFNMFHDVTIDIIV